MGICLQILGFIILIITLVMGVITIMDGTSATPIVALLVISGALVNLGRKIYEDSKR